MVAKTCKGNTAPVVSCLLVEETRTRQDPLIHNPSKVDILNYATRRFYYNKSFMQQERKGHEVRKPAIDEDMSKSIEER
jgi:hypothetical protein